MVKVFGIIWGLGFGGIPWITTVLPAISQYQIYKITYFIGIITIVILGIFAKIMPKRTDYGNEIIGKLKGFKRFLETAEKLQLEELVNKNPEYFYNILPYTYALDVSEVWMKQFESIAMQAPNWYAGYNTFSVYEFNHFMNNTMKTAQTNMTAVQQDNSGGYGSFSGGSSSGGGFTGGGFSGGGSGGGGGGSW